MSHTKQVMYSGVKIFSSQIAISLFSIGFTIFLAHVLSKIEFATLAVWSIFCVLIQTITNLGLETSCIQRVPELIAGGKSDEASAMLKTTLLSRTLLSALLAALAFILSTVASQIFLKTDEYDGIIKIMSFGLLFFNLIDSLKLLTPVTQQFGKISLIDVMIAILSRVLSITLYFVLGLKGYIIGLTWTPVIGVILHTLLLRQYLFRKSGFYPWIRLVKYSLPFYARGFARLAFDIDQFIIGIFLNPTVLATYFVAKRLVQYIFMVSSALGGPVVIKLSELKEDGLGKIVPRFSKLSRYYSFEFVPLCLGVASTSYFLLHLYGGHKYTDATFILVLLSFGVLASILGDPYVINVFLFGLPKETLKLDSVVGIANIAFALVFINLIGVTGVALAKLLVFTIGLFYGRYLLKKIIDVKFDLEALKTSLIASVAMAVTIVSLQLIYYNITVVPLYIALGAITFMLVFCHRLEQRDIELIYDFLPSRFKKLIAVFYWCGAKRLEVLQPES